MASVRDVQPVFHEPTTAPEPWATEGPGASVPFSAFATQLRVVVDDEHAVHVGTFGPEPDPDPDRLMALLGQARHDRADDDRYIGLIAAYAGEWEAVTHVHYQGTDRPAFALAELVEFARAYLASLRS